MASGTSTRYQYINVKKTQNPGSCPMRFYWEAAEFRTERAETTSETRNFLLSCIQRKTIKLMLCYCACSSFQAVTTHWDEQTQKLKSTYTLINSI